MSAGLLAAAFIAGIAEGASVLRRSKVVGRDGLAVSLKEVEVISLAVPSMVYGALCVPLSLVSASPGLDAVSALTGLRFEATSSLDGTTDGEQPDSAAGHEATSGRQITRIATESAARQGQRGPSATPAVSPVSDGPVTSDVSDNNERGSPAVARSREDNRRAIAAVRAARHKERNTSNTERRDPVQPPSALDLDLPTSALYRHLSTLSSDGRQYIATLDGKVLPTEFAEAMRRVRIMLVGAGLVTALVTYIAQSADNANRVADTKWKARLMGEDPDLVSAYVHGKKGVVVRLVDQNHFTLDRNIYRGDDKSDANRSSICVLPVACSQERYANIIDTSPLSTTKPSTFNAVYWRLGVTEDEWNKFPISQEWLFETKSENSPAGNDSDGSNSIPFLLVEANVAMGFQDSLAQYRISNDSATSGHMNRATAGIRTHAENRLPVQVNLDRAELASHIISRAAGQRPIPLKNAENDLHAGGKHSEILECTGSIVGQVINIFLGSGTRFQTPDRKAQLGISKMTNTVHNTQISQVQTIYIDGLACVAHAISVLLKKIHFDGKVAEPGQTLFTVGDSASVDFARGAPMETATARGHNNKSDEIVTPPLAENSSDRNPESSTPVLDLFASVGKQIRQACTAAILHSTRLVSRKRRMHLVSDDPNSFRWLRENLEKKGWKLVFHDVSACNNTTIHDCHPVPAGDVALVMCSTDDRTCNLASSIISSRPDLAKGNLIAVVERRSSRDTLDVLTRKSSAKDETEHGGVCHCLCVEEIHEGLFVTARNLLFDGKSARETEDTIRQQYSLLS